MAHGLLSCGILANIYLHWFDRAFHAKDGPAQKKVKAVMVRYADDFVILMRSNSEQVTEFVEQKIEDWLGLKINREKTRVVSLREQGEALDFLGYTFRLDRDLHGRNMRYWNMCPSKKTLVREREKLKEMTGKNRCFVPLPQLIGGLNRHLKGWANYFRLGYSRDVFREINRYVRLRLTRHLQRRSQRQWRPAADTSTYAHLNRMGLITL